MHTLPQSTALSVITQLLSIGGMLLNCFSFQQKHKRKLIFLQLFGALLFTAHFFLLNAPLGCMMNAIGIVRAVVFCRKERLEGRDRAWIPVFTALYLGAYVLAFTLLGTAPTPRNFILEFLPVAAMILGTVALALPTARGVRRLSLVASPMWLCYNAVNLSVGGTLSEIFSLCSIVIGIFRYDRKKKEDV